MDQMPELKPGRFRVLLSRYDELSRKVVYCHSALAIH